MTEINLDAPLSTEQEYDLESMVFSMRNAGIVPKIVDAAATKLRHICNFQSLDEHHFRVAILIMMQVLARTNSLIILDRIEGIPLDVEVTVPSKYVTEGVPPVPAISKKRTIMTEADKARVAAAEAKRARKAEKLRRQMGA